MKGVSLFVPIAALVLSVELAAAESSTMATRFGKLSIAGESYQNQLLVNGKRILEGQQLSFVKKFSLADSDVVLINDNSGGNSCPSGSFFFVTLKSGNVLVTPKFGTCYEDEPTVVQKDGRIYFSMTRLGGKGRATFVYSNGSMSENGKVLK